MRPRERQPVNAVATGCDICQLRSRKCFPAGRRGMNGFTLLELLIVVIIVSVLFTFMVMAIRTSSPEELIAEEARRFNQLIQLALDESILRGVEYGIEFNRNGYRFLSSIDGYQWQPMESDKMLRERKLPLDMEIELAIEETGVIIDKKDPDKNRDDDEQQPEEEDEGEDEKDKEKIKPQVFLLSSGEITPEFSARFVIPDVETSYIVKGYFDGQSTAEISEL